MIDSIYWENNTECKYCVKPEEKVNIVKKALRRFGFAKEEKVKCTCTYSHYKIKPSENEEVRFCNNDSCPILHPEILK